MYCPICKGSGIHIQGCPEAEYHTKHYCDFCGFGIHDGEEYIVNIDGDYVHWECADYSRELIKWLGHEIKTMEDEND